MPIDWDALVVGPLIGVFGEPVTYTPKGGSPFALQAVFDQGYKSLDLLGADDPGLSTANPVAGVRVSDFPSPVFPTQGDSVRVAQDGVLYLVMNVEPDGKGGAKLELNVAKVQPS
jgi:hypothetical protein